MKDVAFQVENLDYIFNYAKKQGAVVVKDLWEEKDEFGVVRMARIKTVSLYLNFVSLYLGYIVALSKIMGGTKLFRSAHKFKKKD